MCGRSSIQLQKSFFLRSIDFTFYDLRHTFASRLVMSGVNLPTRQALMGHKDISMALRYTHLSSDHKQRAGRILEAAPG
jgi:integrase